jgi:hypothetical protein
VISTLLLGAPVTLNAVKGTIPSMAPFAALRVTGGRKFFTPPRS